MMALLTALMSLVNGWITCAVVLNRVTENHVGVPLSAPVKAVIAFLIWVSSEALILPELSITSAMSNPQDAPSAGLGHGGSEYRYSNQVIRGYHVVGTPDVVP